ncbi:MAG: 4-(cytidine 5'-diphospho)-2-C-methyl-D-erythritol kinase [Desulfobacterales bacterium]|nr:MAG: 4-(cytidine 5'-diphospho)-2-C-methyl-D-erythritol kinase [Desulfobacterales bacterium]
MSVVVEPVTYLEVKAPAKINYFLKITGKRPDGYHNLVSLMQKITLYDELELRVNKENVISLHCPGSTLPEDDANIVYQAAQLFLQSVNSSIDDCQYGVAITLRKSIPIAAGLGGGSSDAAATLTGLNTMFGDPLSQEQLMAMGVTLGADVPFFIARDSACWAEGIGEQLEAVPTFTDIHLVLVNPGFAVSTKAVYQSFSLTVNEETFNLENSRIGLWKQAWGESVARQVFPAISLYNDLEQVTVSMHSEIQDIKDAMITQGAEAAMMSGSGPTVFSVFNNAVAAQQCKNFFAKHYNLVYKAHPIS